MLSLFIGKRFSRAKKRNQLVSFISLSSTLGIAVGVAVIIIGLSAMNGFERELKNRVLSVIPQAEVEGVQAPIDNWQAVMDVMTAQPDVVAAAPYVRFTGLIENNSKMKAVEVRGVDPKLEASISSLPNYIQGDAWQNFHAEDKQIILGQGVAEKLRVQVGDNVTIMIPPKGNQGKLQAPKRIRVTVTGLLSLGGQIDHNLALLPLKDSQTYLDYGDAVSGVSMKVQDVFKAQDAVTRVGRQLTTYVYLKTWKDKYGFLYHDIQMVREIMYLVMVLVIGVASFNIVSTLMMAVKDRASDIAILRTMGAGDALIRRIFIWYGVMSGVLGSIAGSVIGVLVALNLTPLISQLESLIGYQFLSGDIYFVDFLPSQVAWVDVAFVSGTAISLSLLATWYPATKASQLNPATVLSGK
ncbi:MAG: lipoprotein-releasing ABC transporter permease subunit LolE [Vibrio sp.]